MHVRLTRSLLALSLLLTAVPLQAAPLAVDWYTARLITPGSAPGTTTPAVLTPNSDPLGSHAGVRLRGTSEVAGFERWFHMEAFWQSNDPSWVGRFSDNNSSLDGYVPSDGNRFGVEVTVTDPLSADSATGTFFPMWAYIGTVNQTGSSLGVLALTSGANQTLTVGGHDYQINLSAGEFGYDPYDGFVAVQVNGPDGVQTPPTDPPTDPPPSNTNDPVETPEPATLLLAALGAVGFLVYRRMR